MLTKEFALQALLIDPQHQELLIKEMWEANNSLDSNIINEGTDECNKIEAKIREMIKIKQNIIYFLPQIIGFIFSAADGDVDKIHAKEIIRAINES